MFPEAHKVSFYVDDFVFFVQELDHFFVNLINILSEYASVSGYLINEKKSVLMRMYSKGDMEQEAVALSKAVWSSVYLSGENYYLFVCLFIQCHQC